MASPALSHLLPGFGCRLGVFEDFMDGRILWICFVLGVAIGMAVALGDGMMRHF